MLKKYLVLAMLLLLATGCAAVAGSPLQQANGKWQLSYEATLAASPDLRELISQDPEVEQYMRQNMESLVLIIDPKTSQLSLMVDDELENASTFTLVSEDAEAGEMVIDLDGDNFTMRVQGDTLEWLEDGDIMVFTRIK